MEHPSKGYAKLISVMWQVFERMQPVPANPFTRDDVSRMSGFYVARSGERLRVVLEGPELYIRGAPQARRYVKADSATVCDVDDPESIVEFSDMRDGGYVRMTISHPLRLSLIAHRADAVLSA